MCSVRKVSTMFFVLLLIFTFTFSFGTNLGVYAVEIDGDDTSENANENPIVSNEVVSTTSALVKIIINNEEIEDFSPEKLDYEYQFEEGMNSYPFVWVIPYDEKAEVTYSRVTQYPCEMVIKVVDSTGEETQYRIKMTVEGMADGDVVIINESPLSTMVQIMPMGIWLPPTQDEFVVEKKSTKIRFWVSEQLLYPEIWIHEVIGDVLSESPVVKVTTSELSMNTGSGKHSRSSAINGEGGYYKFNLKGKNYPIFETTKQYALVIMDQGEIVEFGPDNPAILKFTVIETVNTTVNERNKSLNDSRRSSSNKSR